VESDPDGATKRHFRSKPQISQISQIDVCVSRSGFDERGAHLHSLEYWGDLSRKSFPTGKKAARFRQALAGLRQGSGSFWQETGRVLGA
jgi:hypothetical protein